MFKGGKVHNTFSLFFPPKETPEETLQRISIERETREENVHEGLTAAAGVNRPRLQIILLLLLTCFRVLHF
ncbi:hypothetical protein AMELA_G00164580 [Ameiurus melas]|uniref:Uncharacterized protein n=1 Tax=Ameiurus melas TaxID=219545 RepID=A0A7J6AFY1_AMEME|nr:hypothetical protein AMELA_G00164580 [Ameiurus melas]